MFLRALIGGFLFAGTLLSSAGAEEQLPATGSVEDNFPATVTNVALPHFGDRVGGGSDYGLANVEPVEVGMGVGRGREIRVFRTSRELRLSRRNEARFQVRLGEVDGVYFWIETPPTHGRWHVTLTVLYPDGYSKTVFGANMRRNGINWAHVPRRALLEVRVTSVEQTFKLSKRFRFAVSPVMIALWPNFVPVPNKTLWD